MELGFSVIWNQGQPDPLPNTLAGLDAPCRLHRMSWDEVWKKLVEVAVYKTELDVSQMPSPWVGNFCAMDALRPFSRREVAALGGADVFLPAAWNTAFVGDDRNVWSIPWVTDVRVIYYWRDLLEQAGVDAETAFQTPERFEETLATLQESGVTPWIAPTHSHFLTLQNVISWVWQAGESLVSDDGRRVFLDRPGVRAAVRAYLDLHRYMPQPLRPMTNFDVCHMFSSRQAAVTMGPGGWLSSIGLPDRVAELRALLGLAVPPGPAYVGGSNLVVWRHTIHTRSSLNLISFLTDVETQVTFCAPGGTMPARLAALDQPPFSTDPHYRRIVEALKSGRSFPTFPRWGLVEERMSSMFVQLWDDVIHDPDQDLDEAIERHLRPLTQRLEMTLGTADTI